jgi:hypothetical protein
MPCWGSFGLHAVDAPSRKAPTAPGDPVSGRTGVATPELLSYVDMMCVYPRCSSANPVMTDRRSGTRDRRAEPG